VPDNKSVGNLMFRAAVMRNFSFVIAMAVSFITMPMIIHLLGDNWYGIWVIVGTFMGYFGIIDFGLSSATTRYLALHWKEKKIVEIGKTVTTSFVAFSVISIIVMILSMIAIWQAPEFLDDKSFTPMLRIVLLILAIDMAMTFPVSVYQAVLVTQMRNDLIAFVKMTQAIIKFGLVYWIVYINGTIIHIALMTLGLNILMRVSIIIAANNYLPDGALRPVHFCKKALKEYFHFGKFTFLGQIGDMVRFRLDVMVIAGFIGSSLVVPYEIALQLLRISSEASSNVIAGTQPVFTRYFAEGRMDMIQEKLLFLTRVNVSVSAILSCSLILVARPLIAIWVGPDYLPAFWPLLILAVIAPLGVGQNAATQTFYAMSRHRYYAYINICEAGANLMLSLILVRPYGIVGVALGTAIPFLLSKIIFVPYYICKFTGLSLSDYLLNLLKPVGLIFVAEAACFGLVTYYQVDNFWLVFPIVAMWQVMLIIALLKFFTPKEDYAYIANTAPVIRKILNREY